MSAVVEQVEYVSVERAIPMRRVWAMPCADTFDIAPIGGLVRWYLSQSKVSVDPFARNKRWATHTNDLNPNTTADSHMDATDYLTRLVLDDVRADLIIIDPPYSPRQVKECYDSIGHKMEQGDALLGAIRGKLKTAINSLLAGSGIVIHCGWNTVGMGLELGYECVEFLLVCHGSDHNDTIVTVERKVESAQAGLFSTQQVEFENSELRTAQSGG